MFGQNLKNVGRNLINVGKNLKNKRFPCYGQCYFFFGVRLKSGRESLFSPLNFMFQERKLDFGQNLLYTDTFWDFQSFSRVLVFIFTGKIQKCSPFLTGDFIFFARSKKHWGRGHTIFGGGVRVKNWYLGVNTIITSVQHNPYPPHPPTPPVPTHTHSILPLPISDIMRIF